MNRRGADTFAIAFAAAAAGCSRTTPTGGLMVTMEIDGTLSAMKLTQLVVEVRAPLDGGRTWNKAYQIPKDTPLPARLPIESNGDPASIVIAASIWQGTQPIDAREYLVEQIPADHYAPISILFSAHCTPLVRPEGTTAGSKCPNGQTCDPNIGACAGNVIVIGRDGAASEGTEDAGAETIVDAGPVDGTLLGAAEGGERPLDATVTCDAGDPLCPGASTTCMKPCKPRAEICHQGQCVAIPPSCLGMSDNHDCLSDEVPGGFFFRSYDGMQNLDRSAPATVSGFRLDDYEVTVERFNNFVTAVVASSGMPDAGAGRHTHLHDTKGLLNVSDAGPAYETGWDPTWNANLATTLDAWNTNLTGFAFSTWYPHNQSLTSSLPINAVTWYEAYAFCIWDGGFLPSEAEWNYAAAGGGDPGGQRLYPWGAADPGTSSAYAVYGCYYGGGSGPCSGWNPIAPVGSIAAGEGRFGQMDLAGNMWEWTLDAYAPYATPCDDCAALGGTEGVFRGGAFIQSAQYLETASRVHGGRAARSASVGFRCARTP
jgi:formylglycine-generating enzyme required for sulfatase activity